mmetsp:Transcript_46485/g.116906  ORF Transcript_46485/g.116906 Transcript_46485/m.116906 type:complete len:113 (+) Transcript_46485:203-541(+)
MVLDMLRFVRLDPRPFFVEPKPPVQSPEDLDIKSPVDGSRASEGKDREAPSGEAPAGEAGSDALPIVLFVLPNIRVTRRSSNECIVSVELRSPSDFAVHNDGKMRLSSKQPP